MPCVSAVDWLDSLSPWPHRFGLERMHTMLAELGDPQDAYPAVHVVGTNGKSTAAVTVEQLLLSEGLRVGTTISPHVTGWSERIRLNGADADFEHAVELVRPVAERLGATQFETVTAAALASVRRGGRRRGGRRGGPRGQARRDERPSHAGRPPDERRRSSTPRSSERHSMQIAREKLAVAKEGSVVVLPDETYAPLVAGHEIRYGGARKAAEAFVGHEIAADVAGRAPRTPRANARRRSGTVRTIPTVFASSSSACPRFDFTLVVSILADKDAGKMLEELRRAGSRLVATASSSARALPAAELARLARPHFDHVEVVEPPASALERAHELGEPVLVTGSLYLLGDLAQAEQER